MYNYRYLSMVDVRRLRAFHELEREMTPVWNVLIAAYAQAYVSDRDGYVGPIECRFFADDQGCIHLGTLYPVPNWSSFTVDGYEVFYPGPRSSLDQFISPDEYRQSLSSYPVFCHFIFDSVCLLQMMEPAGCEQLPYRLSWFAEEQLMVIESMYPVIDPAFVPYHSMMPICRSKH